MRFDSAAEVVELLTDRFGIDLTGLGDVEARVSEVQNARRPPGPTALLPVLERQTGG